MEVYIAPPEGSSGAAHLTRSQVLAAFAQAGLTVAATEEKRGNDHAPAFWIVPFENCEAWLQFQETDAGLVFATLEHSMFDNSDYPDRICTVLEHLGWEVDQENVG
jgi:hypothetical protein